MAFNIQRRLSIFQQIQRAQTIPTLSKPIIVNNQTYDKQITAKELGIKTMLATIKSDTDCCSQIFDVNRPIFFKNCSVSALDFDQDSFWHSSAHILGYAIELNYKDALLAHGPPVDQGFFYDFGTSAKVSELDYDRLETDIQKIIKAKYKFERIDCIREQALDIFQYNKYKTELIKSKIAPDEMTSVYKIGDFIDLCTGPHIEHTGYAKAFKLIKHSSSYWLADATKDSLQRIYAISFPEKNQLKEFIEKREEALKRDHRELGQNQKLFFWSSKFAPGSAFFLPHGAVIYEKLVNLMKLEYKRRNFKEVVTPNIFNVDLWKVSGHYKNYKDDLFLLPTNDEKGQWQGLKPMNCPGHCLIFANQTHSYRELPLKIADFGVLHRNELTGALSGLTRVRRFQQDDAHIFCRQDQIEEQITECLQFLDSIYGLFGFQYEIKLATKPEQSMGSAQMWSQAEQALRDALKKSGKEWGLKEGDGAFYGPKIDIQIKDALGRAIQCGTIQLDFQLPIRFNLQYSTGEDSPLNLTKAPEQELASEIFDVDEFSNEKFEWKEQALKPGCARPVMIHRAILGSVERFIAILTEHLAAKWPLWLSPRQVCVVPISEKSLEYCAGIAKKLKESGFEVELDSQQISLNKKVRNAQLNQFNFIVVAGEEEAKEGVIDIRSRDGQRLGKQTVNEFVSLMLAEYPPSVPKPHPL